MYGPSESDWVFMLFFIAVIGGLVFVGAEHLILWIMDHVHVTWGWAK